MQSVPAPLPGDTDEDGDIDDGDLATAFSNYTGPIGLAGGKTPADGDTDADGDVDDADLGKLFSAYTGPMAGPAVPEPGSALSLGLLCMMAMRPKANRLAMPNLKSRRLTGIHISLY